MSETLHRSPSPPPPPPPPPKLHHGEEDVDRYKPNYRRRRVLLLLFLLLILLAGVTALVLYLVYRPSHPRFSITSASIIALQPAAPSAISSAMQFTLRIRNPNDRASVAYDRLAAYAAYRGQPITPSVPFLPLFQERRSEVSVAPVLGNRAPVPVPADVAGGLATDQAYGLVALRLVVLGRVRFKSGPFRSGWHSLRVRCDVLVGLNAGLVPPFVSSECDVDA